jgi:signal transduction histidine kinase
MPPQSQQALLRHIAGTRALLALAAGLTLLPAAPSRLAALVLLGYSVAATLLLALSLRGWPLAGWRLWLWLDALVLLLASLLLPRELTALTALTVLPVVAMALLWGLHSAVLMALGCATMLWLLAGGEGDALMTLAVPYVLLALAPAVALLNRPGAAPRQRQRLLEAFTRQADPRHGLEHQVQALLGLLGGHFALELAVLDLPGPQPRVFRWEAGARMKVLEGEALQSWHAQREALPPDLGFISGTAPTVWTRALDPASGAPGLALQPQACRVLLGAGTQALWMPLRSYGRTQGQLCLARHDPPFTAADLRWLHALMHDILPLLERTDLLEQLQHETAARERERIGRDLHDSAVQPYLGLKYGLEALARVAGADNPVSPQLAQLVQMTNDELQTLRDTVRGLRRGHDPYAPNGTLAALLRQAQRFEALYGLKVELQLPEQAPPLHGALAKALLLLFNEALTNVRRHTQATTVTVQFDVQPERLCMRLRNDRPAAEMPAPFKPRSLSERAQEFGGQVMVSHPPGCTEVAIALPLTGNPA